MARAIAICKDGPLDGSILSVELGEDGRPLPLTSRSEVCGVLYVPGAEVPVDPAADADFPSLEHQAAFEYAPEEVTAGG